MAGIRCEAELRCPVHILLAEDDPNDQMLFCTAAAKTRLSLRIQTVGHGFEVLEYLAGTGPYADREAYRLPDVLVLDLRMPLMDGFEVLAWCRDSPAFRSLPVAALSGSVDQSWAQRALAAGASRFFRKSFQLAHWMAIVREVADLGRPQAFQPQSAPEPELAGTAR